MWEAKDALSDESKTIEERLRTRLDRYRLSLSALPEGVILIRTGMTIEWCNPAAERHLGVNLNHVGLSVSEVFSPTILMYLTEGEYGAPIIVPSLERGRELQLEVLVADNSHAIMVTTDVTEARRVEAMRRDFVANVSHELRTPLTVITGFLDMMVNATELDRDTQVKHMQLVLEQASRMKNLVDDLLVLSRLESKDENDSSVMDIINMVKMTEALAAEARTISRGQHAIELTALSSRAVVGDPDEIRSACLNLVTNAIRYTPDGGTIEIGWIDDDELHTRFFVRDTGIGIATEDMSRLTERFYRVDKSRSRDVGGTGLGLAIVKHAALRNDAQLLITSTLGVGSTFSLQFAGERLIE